MSYYIKEEEENRGFGVKSLSGLHPGIKNHNVKYNSISASASAWANGQINAYFLNSLGEFAFQLINFY